MHAVCPSLSEYVPFPHGEGLEALAKGQKVPTGHWVGEVDPSGQNEPAMQVMHVTTVGQWLPGGQMGQGAVRPKLDEYVPSEQAPGVDRPSLEQYVPAGHSC